MPCARRESRSTSCAIPNVAMDWGSGEAKGRRGNDSGMAVDRHGKMDTLIKIEAAIQRQRRSGFQWKCIYELGKA